MEQGSKELSAREQTRKKMQTTDVCLLLMLTLKFLRRRILLLQVLIVALSALSSVKFTKLTEFQPSI